MDTMILGSVTRKEINEEIASLKKNMATIKKITDTKVIDKEKVYRLMAANKKAYSALHRIQGRIEHWYDVIKE